MATQTPEQLDPNVVAMMRALREHESNNKAVLPQEKGIGGASIYQYTTSTWKGVAQKYLGDANAPLDRANENKATYYRIKEWKDKGFKPAQIASMWNAGEGEPDAYTGKFSNGKPSVGVNSYGVKYDVPAHAKSVLAKFQAEIAKIPKPVAAPVQAQEPVQRQKGFLEKASDVGESVFGKPRDFLFGSTGKTVGGLLSAGLASGAELAGKKTIFGADTEKLRQAGEEQAKPLNIAATTLELIPGGSSGKTAVATGEKLAAPLAARAEKMYMSVLKPSKELLRKSPDVVKTGLEEGAKISKAGLSKVTTLLDTIGTDIDNVIEAGKAAGKTVESKPLLGYLDEMKDYFSKVVGGDELAKEVDVLGKKFIKELPEQIPVEKAQEIKRATQSFVKKYYNREAPIQFEVRKQLARGLKDQIADAVPEIAKLNARDKKLIGLEEALGNAMERIGKRELFSWGDLQALGLGSVIGGAAPAAGAATASFVYKIIKSPAFTSSRAIIYNNIAKNAGNLLKAGRIPAAIAAAKVLELFSQPENE